MEENKNLDIEFDEEMTLSDFPVETELEKKLKQAETRGCHGQRIDYQKSKMSRDLMELEGKELMEINIDTIRWHPQKYQILEKRNAWLEKVRKEERIESDNLKKMIERHKVKWRKNDRKKDTLQNAEGNQWINT